ncbi:MAG: hypothetical protein BWY21_02018 [Parcubacteria group bacterium ADurb.Bin216]|nr:MAG: hypothetical protein BWY21_02018 [Parcubacteria group bacterium ADurb.Bin216]
MGLRKGNNLICYNCIYGNNSHSFVYFTWLLSFAGVHYVAPFNLPYHVNNIKTYINLLLKYVLKPSPS